MKKFFQKIKRPQKKVVGWRKYALICLPYLWMALFFFVPFLIILKISFAESAISIPPYTSLFTFEDDKLQISLNLYNYISLCLFKIIEVCLFFNIILFDYWLSCCLGYCNVKTIDKKHNVNVCYFT